MSTRRTTTWVTHHAEDGERDAEVPHRFAHRGVVEAGRFSGAHGHGDAVGADRQHNRDERLRFDLQQRHARQHRGRCLVVVHNRLEIVAGEGGVALHVTQLRHITGTSSETQKCRNAIARTLSVALSCTFTRSRIAESVKMAEMRPEKISSVNRVTLLMTTATSCSARGLSQLSARELPQEVAVLTNAARKIEITPIQTPVHA